MKAATELGMDAAELYAKRPNLPYATQVYAFETWEADKEIVDALTSYNDAVRYMLLEKDIRYSVCPEFSSTLSHLSPSPVFSSPFSTPISSPFFHLPILISLGVGVVELLME